MLHLRLLVYIAESHSGSLERQHCSFSSTLARSEQLPASSQEKKSKSSRTESRSIGADDRLWRSGWVFRPTGGGRSEPVWRVAEESERVPATGSFAARLNKEGGAHQDREQRPARSKQTRVNNYFKPRRTQLGRIFKNNDNKYGYDMLKISNDVSVLNADLTFWTQMSRAALQSNLISLQIWKISTVHLKHEHHKQVISIYSVNLISLNEESSRMFFHIQKRVKMSQQLGVITESPVRSLEEKDCHLFWILNFMLTLQIATSLRVNVSLKNHHNRYTPPFFCSLLPWTLITNDKMTIFSSFSSIQCLNKA